MKVLSVGIDRLALSRYRPAGFVARPSPASVARLREHGFLEPLSVVPVEGGKFEIVSAPEPWVAAGLASIREVLVIVRDDLSDQDVEAVVRDCYGVAKTNPIEEAEAFDAQRYDFGENGKAIPIAKLARLTGHERPYVAHSLRLLQLPQDVQVRVRDGRLSAGQARPLLRLASRDRMSTLANRIERDRMSVRDVEALVAGRVSSTVSGKGRGAKAVDARPVHVAKSADVLKLEREVSSILGAAVSIDNDSLKIEYHGNYDVLDGILARLGYKAGL